MRGLQEQLPRASWLPILIVVLAVVLSTATGKPEDSPSSSSKSGGIVEDFYAPTRFVSERLYRMPSDFKIGCASAAYQNEGAWDVDGKSPSIWDTFFHARPELVNGDVACDSYHKWEDDVKMLKELKMQVYRFSIAWPRLLPTGRPDNPNKLGVQYYNNLINGLVEAGIEPMVTLHHWDIPQVIQDEGGWQNASIQDLFTDYADFAFKTFGDRVKLWVLLNEPQLFCNRAYELGSFAPGLKITGTGAYTCLHNSILAHAKAYRLYESRYKPTQKGKVGSSGAFTAVQPKTNSAADLEAVERNNEFNYAWFMDPIVFGHYPKQMAHIVKANSRAAGLAQSRLPQFTVEEKKLIKGAYDFLGVNQYTAGIISAGNATAAQIAANPSYANDLNVNSELKSTWIRTSKSVFAITPWGIRNALNYIKDRYNNKPVYITENGYAGFPANGKDDLTRSAFHSNYLRAVLSAINEDGCNVLGYIIWALEDNLSWVYGYNYKYGLVHIDFDSPNRTRTLKKSSEFFKEIMTTRVVPYIKAR